MKGQTRARRAGGNQPTDTSLEELFRREYEPMHRLAFTMLRSDAEAEEVVQDAFLGVAANLGSIDNPGGYLRTSVVNGVRKRLGRGRRHDEFDERSTAGLGGASPSPDYLVDLVDHLPERERTAVVLRYYANWNATEIGEALVCPAGTVRSMLHRSLQQMREMLGDD